MNLAEIRFMQKDKLFSLLVAEETGDIGLQISATRATMEKEDILSVEKHFEEWKRNRNKS
jgi:hypothetical protein